MIKKRINVVRTNLIREKSIMYERRKMNSPEDVVDLFNQVVGDSDRENFIVIALNTKNEFNQIQVVSIGTIDSALVIGREVFTGLVLSNASRFIAIHNHPSGNITPSKDDHSITDKLEKAGELMGIKLLDHIIVGDGEYFSFKEYKAKEENNDIL